MQAGLIIKPSLVILVVVSQISEVGHWDKEVASCFAYLDQTVIQKAMRLFRPAFQCIYGSGKHHAGMPGRMSLRSFLDYNLNIPAKQVQTFEHF